MKEALKRILPQNKFARAVSVLAGGAAAGQAIVILVSPLLTRLYNPEDFGLMAVFTAMVAILTIVSSLRYPFAIPLPENDDDAADVAALCAALILLSAGVVSVIVWQFSGSISASFGLPDLDAYLWLLPFAVFFAGAFQVLHLWAIREGAFNALARAKFNQALGMTVVQVITFPLGVVGLLLGKTAQQGVGVGTLSVVTLRKRWPHFRRASCRSAFQAALVYRKFPLYSLWGGVASKIGSELPSLAFAIFFSPALAGHYILANRVCALPMSLVGRAVADAFYSNAGPRARAGQLGTFVQEVHERLAYIALPPVMTLFIAGPDLFELIFGLEWREGGVIARWLAPMLYAQFTVAPVIRALMAIEQQAVDTVLQFLMVAVRIGSITLGILLSSFYIAMLAFSISSAFIYALYYIVILIRCDMRVGHAWRPSGEALLLGALLNTPTLFGLWWSVKPLGMCAMALFSAGFITAYYLLLFKSKAGKLGDGIN